MTNIEKRLIEFGFEKSDEGQGYVSYKNKRNTEVIIHLDSLTFDVSSSIEENRLLILGIIRSTPNPFDAYVPDPTIVPTAVSVNYDKRLIAAKFADGDLRVVRCSPDDEFDPEIGLSLAITRHVFGSRNKLRKFILRTKTIGKPGQANSISAAE